MINLICLLSCLASPAWAFRRTHHSDVGDDTQALASTRLQQFSDARPTTAFANILFAAAPAASRMPLIYRFQPRMERHSYAIVRSLLNKVGDSSSILGRPSNTTAVLNERSRPLSFTPLRRARQAIRLKQKRDRASDEIVASDPFSAIDPTPVLGFMLVVLLSLINVMQVERLGNQVAFLRGLEDTYGDLGRQIVDEVLHSDEFNHDVSDVVGQTLAEMFGTPLLIITFEVCLNAALARAFGSKLIPFVLVGEAGIEAISEVAGQGLGNVVGEQLRPWLDSVLSAVDHLDLR